MALNQLVACLTPSCLCTPLLAEPPPRPLSSFEAAKKAARDGIYSEHHTDLYCGCAWSATKTGSGGRIDASGCGYKFRKNKGRGQVLEWEHVVPAAFFGQQRACWRTGHEKCVKSDCTLFKGRACCVRVDRT